MGEAAVTSEPAAAEAAPSTGNGAGARGRVRRWIALRRAPSQPDAQPDAPAATEAAPRSLAPTAYRTFSPKLAPSLTALGGVLALIGGLGTWLRATKVVTEGLAAEEVEVVMGYEDPAGVAIAALGGACIVLSLVWAMRRWPLLKLLPLACAGVAIGLAAWKLPLLDDRVAVMAREAREGTLDFVSYHAGFGWGSWCLVAACVLLALGAVVGLLRELDLRKGIPQ